MTDKVDVLRCITQLDLSPERVLEGAKGKLTGVVIAGWDKDGNMYLASTFGDRGETLWLLEQAKQELLGIE
jgi:hypothetical protein